MKPTRLSSLGLRTAEPPISWLMKLTLDRPELISLAAGFTDFGTLPVDETRRLVNRLLKQKTIGQAALQYGTTIGDDALRQLTAERLRHMDGRAARSPAVYAPERFVMTHGSQQLLYLITEALCDPGDIVFVEDPTYFVFLSILQSRGVECRGVRLEPDGLDLEHLAQSLESLAHANQLHRVKLLYTVSYWQNPTGTTTAWSKKIALSRLLRRFEKHAGHTLYWLEDAAYRELRFAGEDVPSALASPDAAARVIYAGTYSKPFATGIRVGFGALPDTLRDVVLRLKGNHDFGTSNWLQQLLAESLRSGEYDRHLPLIQQRYRRKAGVMARALQQWFPASTQWRPATGGMYVWTRLDPPLSTDAKADLFQRALKAGVLYVPGALCYADDPTRPKPNHEMRLSFACSSLAQIREGIRRLGCILNSTS